MGKPTRRRSVANAFWRGVLPVRRPVSPESLTVVAGLTENIEPELEGTGRAFVPHMLGVTVVGFSRFNPYKHHAKGPRTIDVARTIPSADRPLRAEIGRLMVAGSGSKFKLAAELISPDLQAEEDAYREEFARQGFPLRKDYNAPDDRYHPHLSFALLHSEYSDYYQDPDLLDRLGVIGEAVGKRILLDPADLRK